MAVISYCALCLLTDRGGFQGSDRGLDYSPRWQRNDGHMSPGFPRYIIDRICLFCRKCYLTTSELHVMVVTTWLPGSQPHPGPLRKGDPHQRIHPRRYGDRPYALRCSGYGIEALIARMDLPMRIVMGLVRKVISYRLPWGFLGLVLRLLRPRDYDSLECMDQPLYEDVSKNMPLKREGRAVWFWFIRV